ncbi:cytochrome bc complex cytochrome b subunit [Georgenia sp. TF02-10]|uniref:cytochrome bc1 complex cytochrome b subunit n=1 Tax=Georgenia sp. TF02-10 TaxID=2917725 RepID=UPI001FA72AE5|nr:cytochrome bc complex cytochrome b subunit [Georgenia sp. TF02-10]UNX53420.1 cytochrome bc complex cytochrome b subunit [Georgenia sp. TF02-10]
MSTTTAKNHPVQVGPGIAKTADYLDTRVGIAKAVKFISRKVFPEHWSFMLGEIALWSFVVLVLTGIFLTMFFVPSMAHTTYPEDALPVSMQGVAMSEAFASVLHMSFEVRGGLLMRQIHHWAALLFMAAIVVHMFRVFFTGAFRKPRELNYLVGFTLLLLGLAAGFSGYSLPDDVLSGNGLRIADGVLRAIPIIGAHASYALFGGEFPGTDIIPRLFTVHILLVPALIIALVTVHLLLMVVHKHTQYPGVGRTNTNVVGYPAFPIYVTRMAGFFFTVFGFLALMGTFLSINSVWNYGPYDPSPVSAGAQPDWYMLFLEGALRMMPGWEIVIGGYTLSLNVLIPGVVVPGVLFTLLAVYPFLERAATNDLREHHVLDRPRNVPVRTAIGVAIITEFVILVLAGSNDIMATHFDLSINDITWTFRVLFFVGPVIAFIVTKRLCLSLQRRDRELALHGHETGRVVQLPNGAFMEVHKPLSDEERWLLVAHEPYRPLELEPATDRNGVDRPGYRRDALRQRLSRFFYEDRVEPVTPAEVTAQHHGGEIIGDDGPRHAVRGGTVELEAEVPREHHDDGASNGSKSIATLVDERR